MAVQLNQQSPATQAVTIAAQIRATITQAKRAHNRMTKAQHQRDAAVRAAIELGATQTKVAEALGMSHTGVQYILKQATP